MWDQMSGQCVEQELDASLEDAVVPEVGQKYEQKYEGMLYGFLNSNRTPSIPPKLVTYDLNTGNFAELSAQNAIPPKVMYKNKPVCR